MSAEFKGTLNLDVTKIDKSEIHQGEKGKYLNLAFFENAEEDKKYGNDGYVVQEISRERREAGERGPIIGNWKHPKKREPASTPGDQAQQQHLTTSNVHDVHGVGGDEDDIPF